jgi:hypothetical protein
LIFIGEKKKKSMKFLRKNIENWWSPKMTFSDFSCMFLNPNNFFQFDL